MNILRGKRLTVILFQVWGTAAAGMPPNCHNIREAGYQLLARASSAKSTGSKLPVAPTLWNLPCGPFRPLESGLFPFR